MSWTVYLIPFGLTAGFLIYGLLNRSKQAEAADAASRTFFEQTGYRFAEIADHPIEHQVAHRNRVFGQRSYEAHLVRGCYGHEIHAIERQQVHFNSVSQSGSWFTPLPRPARVLMQVADRDLCSLRKAVREVFSSRSREWTKHYPARIDSGDPELDRRFAFFGHDAHAVREALRQQGMRDLLLSCAEVDLVVHPNQVVFADPSRKNVSGGMGGSWYTHTTAVGIAAHNRIAELLAVTARACG